jgi:Cu/Ag efflux protein CusF
MNIVKSPFAGAVVLILSASGAMAQQALSGSITKLDEANGTVTIQQTETGTVGSNAARSNDDFKVQDGLLFNAMQVGDKVTFSATEDGGVKTITKLQKQ